MAGTSQKRVYGIIKLRLPPLSLLPRFAFSPASPLGEKLSAFSLEQLRKVLGPESAKDSAFRGEWANFQQRALELAIAEINKKTDLNIELESIERAQRRVTDLVFSIATQAIPDGDSSNL